MQNTELKSILKEYEEKRFHRELVLEQKKQEIYAKCPRLQEIEDTLKKLGITTVQSIANSDKTTHLQKIQELNQKIQQLKTEKQQLLASLQLSEKDLLPVFDCPICEDTGYTKESNGTVMCSCLTQKLLNTQYNKSNITNIQKENFENFNLLYYSDKVDTEKYSASISPRDNIQIIKGICEKFIQNFDDPSEKNLLFVGNTKNKKTFLSNCIAGEILAKRKTVLYQTAPVMFDSILDDKFGKTHNNTMEHILNANLLIIDDLGTEYRNDLKFADLYEIINTRLLHQEQKITKTIISTNLNITALFKTYDERIVSRLVEHYNICRFFGEDIRFQKK